MAHIKREQLAAIGIHYVYYPLDYMLDSQAKAGYKTIELLGMAPHYLMDETWYQDPAEVRKKVEDRGMTIGCFTPECAVYYYTMNAPEGGFHIPHQSGIFGAFHRRTFEYAAEIVPAHLSQRIERQRQEFRCRDKLVHTRRPGKTVMRTYLLAFVTPVDAFSELLSHFLV